MEKKSLFAVAIVLTLSALIASAYIWNQGAQIPQSNEGAQIPQSNADSRPQYPKINGTVFADLPAYPKDFILIRRNFYDNQIKDLSRLDSSVWKQPEFYPTWERNGIFWFTQHDYERWGIHGWGTFPSEMQYTVGNMSRGNSLDIYTYIHASWGIETWQGMKVGAVYNESVFDVKVSPDVLLLEPTFPKFYNNWTQLLKINITAKQDVPQGQYTFSLVISPPPQKQSENWVWDVLDKYTNSMYHSQISECKKYITLSDTCASLTMLRQNKYVPGGMFSPSSVFKATLIVE